MSSEGSDVEMRSAIPKKPLKKAPKSPTELEKQPKKVSTKDMIHDALTNLKSRKGTSLYAIKKFMKEKYNIDTEKLSYLIKKNLKASVEMGTIVQTKGIGASGSFRLAPAKKSADTKEKPKKTKQSTKKTDDSEVLPRKQKATKKDNTKSEGTDKGPVKKVQIAKTSKSKDKPPTQKLKKVKETESKTGKTMKTPKKRSALMKRKSIGSIIKPPKMRPKKV